MSLGRCFPDDTPDEYPPGALAPFCVDCAAGRPYCDKPCADLLAIHVDDGGLMRPAIPMPEDRTDALEAERSLP
jgi:hypothetical protein